MMWQLFIDRFSADHIWFMASNAIMLMMLILIFWSMFRHIRHLAWFSIAGLLTGFVYVLAGEGFPIILEWMFDLLSRQTSASPFVLTILISFFEYVVIYAALALVITLTLVLWSLVSFRWQRCRILLHRSMAESWLIVLFAGLHVLSLFLIGSVFGLEILTPGPLVQLFQMMSFIYCLQLFLRLIDTAHLQNSKVFMEFSFTTGLGMLLFKFLLDWGNFLYEVTGDPATTLAYEQTLFLQQLFVFFLGMMLIGYLACFFVKGLFVSKYFLERRRRLSGLSRWTLWLLLSGREPTYPRQNIVTGVIVSISVGFIFLLIGFQGWSLGLIPAFFLSYFLLFYLLDRQEDARIRGEIVDKRIDGAHFFSS
jgi:hypothetical protein